MAPDAHTERERASTKEKKTDAVLTDIVKLCSSIADNTPVPRILGQIFTAKEEEKKPHATL